MSYRPVTAVSVHAWGTQVGAVARNPASGAYVFEYAPEWIARGIELSPMHMPLGMGTFEFSRLPHRTWRGLPPMLADTLPDGFGNRLVNEWMREQGIAHSDITPLDRLAYASDRALGALEYRPPVQQSRDQYGSVIQLSDIVTAARATLDGDFSGTHASEALQQLLQVGTSAGGARAKALVAYDPSTRHITSPYGSMPPNHTPWLIKLDVPNPPDVSIDGRSDPLGAGAGYGRIEYAYHLMARDAGVTMSPSVLLEENGRAHFLTRRFDRTEAGDKVHTVTLCALDHLDFNAAGEHSYDQYLDAITRLGMSSSAIAEGFRRMVFNVVAANRDDHTKNLSFTVDSTGTWALAPAYDITHAHNLRGEWTSRHQMRVNGKTDSITLQDLHAVGERHDVPGYRGIVREVVQTVAEWPRFAREAGIVEDRIQEIGQDLQSVRPLGKGT